MSGSRTAIIPPQNNPAQPLLGLVEYSSIVPYVYVVVNRVRRKEQGVGTFPKSKKKDYPNCISGKIFL